MPTASCHCQAVRIEVDTAPDSLNQCHCSICRRYGTLWGYYQREQVRVLCAAGATEAYSRGSHVLAFHRCRTCGCITHWTSSEPDEQRMAINGRLLEAADLAGIPVRRSEGPPA